MVSEDQSDLSTTGMALLPEQHPQIDVLAKAAYDPCLGKYRPFL
jgi:hypothetical protein